MFVHGAGLGMDDTYCLGAKVQSLEGFDMVSGGKLYHIREI